MIFDIFRLFFNQDIIKLPECYMQREKIDNQVHYHMHKSSKPLMKTETIFLNSGLICKVSAGNENAFQTTSYLSALSNQEDLLLPLVLGLRRWAQVCFQLRPSSVAHISQATRKGPHYAYLFFVKHHIFFLTCVVSASGLDL